MASEPGERMKASDSVTRVVTFGALVLLFLAVAVNQIADFDFWWLWATGRYVAENGIPRTDAFSFASEGRPWIELRWLFCLGLYGASETLGYAGANLVKVGVLGVTAGLTARVSRAWSPVAGAAVGLLAILAASPRFIIRPEVASYLFFALFLFLIARHREGNRKALFLLPVLQVVWVNTHTIFILGPLVALAYVAHTWLANEPDANLRMRRRKDALLAFGLTAIACLINPYGFGSYTFAFQIFSEMRDSIYATSIAELRGPFDLGLGFVSIKALLALGVVVALIGLASFRRLDVFLLIVTAAMAYLAFKSVRNMPLFAIAAVPFALHHIAHLREEPRMQPLLRNGRLAAYAVAIAACLFYAQQFATNRVQVAEGLPNLAGIGVAEHHFAQGAAEYLIENGVEGRIFATMDASPYLIARGYQTLFDPRLEVHGEELYKRYIQIEDQPDKFRLGEETYGFTLAVLNLRSPAVSTVLSLDDWALVYFDEVACVFVKQSANPNLQPLDREAAVAEVEEIRGRLPSPTAWNRLGLFERAASPLPYFAVSRFLQRIKLPEHGLPFAQDAVQAKPFDPGFRAALASLFEESGDLAAAREQYEAAIRLDPNNLLALHGYGRLLLQTQDFDQARIHLEHALKIAPEDAAVWADMAGVEMGDNDAPGATEALQRAIQLDPSNADYRRLLGEVYATRGMFEQAYEELQQANSLRPGDRTTLLDLAVVAFRLGRRDEARTIAEDALKRWPGDEQFRQILERLEEG